jgi:GT2 family glycosyltransferase
MSSAVPVNLSVSVVVPVLNDARRLERCLSSILRSQGLASPPELIVVDNGSVDDSAAAARAIGARVISAPGVRVADVRNRGAAAATSDVVAFVDADHEQDPSWLALALETLALPGVAAVGAAYFAPPDGTWVQRAYDGLRSRPRTVQDVPWLPTGSLAVARKVFQAVGGFDASLEACEDVDFCERLRAHGHRLVYDPRLVSVHHGDPPTLWALFVGELWRGRDNLRVSLRPPIRLQSLPSVVTPVLVLMSLVFAVAGPLLLPVGRAAAAAPLLVFAAGASALRAARMWVHLPRRTLMTGLQALAVATVYEIARALALVVRAPHSWRRAVNTPAETGRPTSSG